MSKIKILVVPVQKIPHVEEIENDLKAMQNIVGGLIEFTSFKDDLVIICDEEAKLKSKIGNRFINNHIIAGDFFISADDDEGDLRSLTNSEIDLATKRFSIPELITSNQVNDDMKIEVFPFIF